MRLLHLRRLNISKTIIELFCKEKIKRNTQVYYVLRSEEEEEILKNIYEISGCL